MLNIYKILNSKMSELVYPQLSGLSTIWDIGRDSTYTYLHIDEGVEVPTLPAGGSVDKVVITESIVSTLINTIPLHLKSQLVTFDQLKFNKLREITAAYENAMGEITYNYPMNEISSWSKQESEAVAFQLDSNAPTPLLSAIAAARGLTVGYLVPKVIEKATGYAAISGQIIGKRQKLEYDISLVSENSDYETILNNINWS